MPKSVFDDILQQKTTHFYENGMVKIVNNSHHEMEFESAKNGRKLCSHCGEDITHRTYLKLYEPSNIIAFSIKGERQTGVQMHLRRLEPIMTEQNSGSGQIRYELVAFMSAVYDFEDSVFNHAISTVKVNLG